MVDETRASVVITGASAGLGRDFVRLIASEKRTMVLVARSQQGLEEAAAEARALGAEAHVLALDLGLPEATTKLVRFLADMRLHCDVLIANAGFGVIGDTAELGLVPQMALVDLNVRALTEQTLTFLPGMIARRRGGVLLVASTASYFPGPYMACYYASKAFVRSFGEALHQENRSKGVTVTTLCPGPVRTEFFERAGIRSEPLFKLMPRSNADQVVKAAWHGFLAGRRIVLPGIAAKLTAWSAKLSPTWLVLPILARLQHERRG